jgi:hypothetical protein
MADTGISAATTLTVIGRVAIDPLAEVDLAIDAAGDLLAIDSAGDVLIVTPAATWPGKSAEESV